MSKVWMDADERYPTYSVRSDGRYADIEVEATAEQLERWGQATAAFNAAQDEMGDLYEAAQAVAAEQRRVEEAEREAREKAERRERQRAAEKAASARRAAAEAMVGTVYDADGNPVGEVSQGSSGVRITPIVGKEARP